MRSLSETHPHDCTNKLTWLELLQESVEGHFQWGRAGQASTQGDAAGYHRPEAWERASWGTTQRENSHCQSTLVWYKQCHASPTGGAASLADAFQLKANKSDIGFWEYRFCGKKWRSAYIYSEEFKWRQKNEGRACTQTEPKCFYSCVEPMMLYPCSDAWHPWHNSPRSVCRETAAIHRRACWSTFSWARQHLLSSLLQWPPGQRSDRRAPQSPGGAPGINKQQRFNQDTETGRGVL